MSHVEQVHKAIQADKKIATEIRKAGPFESLIAVAKARNTKHAVAILNCFNRLLTHDEIDQGRLTDVIDALQALSRTNNDVQVKVLQTVPLLLSTSCTVSGPNLAACLNIPIGLLDVSGIVGSIASATLQQVLVSLFDNPPESRQADVSRIFEDLCANFSGNESGFVSFAKVKRPLILELLESILAASGRLFEAHPSLLDANLLPTVISLVKDENTSFGLLVRALRLCALLVPTKNALLASLLQFLPLASSSRQVLILEVLDTSKDDMPAPEYPSVVESLLLFEDAIPGIGSYSVSSAPKSSDEQITADGIVYSVSANSDRTGQGLGEWSRPGRRLMSQLQSTETPTFPAEYKFVLIFNILSIVSSQPQAVWRNILTLHSAFLSSSISAKLESQLLSDISTVVTRLDDLGDKRPRDVYLRRLGRIGVSSSLRLTEPSTPGGAHQSGGELTQRSYACLHMYLRIITDLRDGFDLRAWSQVLDILSTADSLLAMRTRRGMGRTNGSLIGSVLHEDKPLVLDTQAATGMSTLSSSIADFFQTADRISSQSFAVLIEALCTMEQGIPGSPPPSTSMTPRFNSPLALRRINSMSSIVSFGSTIQADPPSATFSMEKIRELMSVNVPRFVTSEDDCGWDTLLEHLGLEIQRENVLAAEILGMIILKATQHGLPDEAHQKKFIYSLAHIEGDGQIRLIQLETLASLLEILGHDLNCGWDLILKILYNSITSGHLSVPEAVRLGFSSLQLICTDYLYKLPQTQMALLVETLVGFSSQKEDFNIALSAVGQFWTILGVMPSLEDFSQEYTQFPEDRESEPRPEELLWLLVMENLIHLSRDTRPEVRNMAIQASFRLVGIADTLGAKVTLTTTHLVIRELHKIPFALDPQAEGFVETVNPVTAGSGRILLAAIERSGRTEYITLLWNVVSEFLRDVSTADRVETAAYALNVLLDIVSTFTSLSKAQLPDLRLSRWTITVEIGQGIFANESSRLTQEGLSTYLQILIALLEDCSEFLEGDDLEKIFDLTLQALAYPRSQTYYLDVDYLSTVQKSSETLILLLLKIFPQHKSLILRRMAQMLELVSTIEERRASYIHVSQKGSNWTGIPTFVAFSKRLQAIVNDQYLPGDNVNLDALCSLIRSMNRLLEQRYVRPSISDKLATHNLWAPATTTILNFLNSIESRLDAPEATEIWQQILSTSEFLFTPHSHQSEEFVVASLNQLRGLILPRLGRQAPGMVEAYMVSLYRGSWFYKQAESIQPSTEMATYYNDQILREWCLLELFKMPIYGDPPPALDDDDGQTVVSSGDTLACDSCADAALPFAVNRARNVLHRYINNARLRAHAPLPQIEYAELLLILEHLGDDAIHHPNQRRLLKRVYPLVVEALLVNQQDVRVLRLLKDTLMRVGEFL